MKKYSRYVVKGSKKLSEHSYSTELGQQKALNWAIQCADHTSMKGDVFGQKQDGSVEFIYSSKENR